MKNSSDTIGNRSRDLPVCSAVPQPMRHRVSPVVIVPTIILIISNFAFCFVGYEIWSFTLKEERKLECLRMEC
jgi:hypothetical protein